MAGQGRPGAARPEVVLVRHGETEWSASGRHTGRTDVPLTDLGRRQAGLLAGILGGRRFALVLTSPLARAADTCRLALPGRACEPCPDLAEWDYGAYEGRTTDDIRIEVPGWTVWTHPVPGGEAPEAVGSRADGVLARVRASGGEAALFGHGHMLRALAARWCGLAARDGRSLALDTATVSVLGYERETPVVRRWNVSAPGE